jgi:hypothetical protein
VVAVMPRSVCPVCEALVEITPTGQQIAQGWTAKWWRIVMHRVAETTYDPYRTGICDGSGRLV